MNKKVALSVLSTAVVASMATSAFAAPKAGLYIGGDVDKFYSLSSFISDVNFDNALQEMNDAGLENVVYVDDNGNAATLDLIAEAEDINDVLEPASEDNFGDSANDEFEEIDEEGNGTVLEPPFDGEAPDFGVISADAEVAEDNTVTISGEVSGAVDVRVTLIDPAGEVVDYTTENGVVLNEDNTFSFTTEEALAEGDWEFEVAAIDENGDESEIETGAFTIEKATPEEVAVESVSAINAKTIEVKFNAEVDTTKVTFTVTRDGNPVVLTPTFAEDKKSATLVSATSLVAGTYVVKAAGVDFEEGKDSGTVDVVAEKVAKIEFASDKIVRSAGTQDEGTVHYKVYNQYDEDITSSTLAQNLSWTASIATDSLSDDNAGVLTINKDATDFADTDNVVLTVIDPTTGVSKSGTFTIAATAALKEVAFGDVTLPSGKTRVEAGQTYAADVAVIAKDQYENDITSAAALTAGTTIVVSDSNVTASFVDVNSKPYLRLNTASLATAKNVTVTVVIKATGQTVSKTFDVVTAPAAAEVSLTAPTTMIAAGDLANSIVVPLTVKDQFGSEMTPAQIAAQAAGFTITSSNSSVISSGAWAIETAAGANQGKLVNKNGDVLAQGTSTITVTVNATGKSATFVVDAKAARALNSVVLPDTLSSNLIQGATTTFALGYKDQYAGDFDATGDVPGYIVNLSVTKVSGDDNGLTISPTGDQVNESSLDTAGAITLQAAAGKTGTYTVTAKLINTTTNETVSQASKTINVVSNSSSNLTYSVGDIPALYESSVNLGTDDEAIDAAEIALGYAKEIKISATDAAGNSYVIPANEILSVTVDNSSVATVGQVSGKWYIAGGDINPGADDIDANTPVNLSVVVNTNEGVKTITKVVTVSSSALVPQEIKLLNKAISDTTATAVTTLTYADRAELKAGKDVYAYVIDQFGGISMNYGTTVTQTVAGPNGFTLGSGDTVTVVSNKLKLTDIDDNTKATAGAKFRYVAITSNGKTASIDATVTNPFGIITGVTSAAAEVTAGVAPVTAVAQVETATVVQDAAHTTGGTVTATVTAAGSANLAAGKAVVSAAIANGDTPASIATKLRTALTNDADVSAFFNVGGTGADIVLTAKTAAANDATMNIALANSGGSDQITPAANSANTTAGVAGVAGVKEVNKLTITHVADASGRLAVTFNDGTINETVYAYVTAGDNEATVAGKVKAALDANTTITTAYDLTIAGAVINFTAKAAAADKATVAITTTNN